MLGTAGRLTRSDDLGSRALFVATAGMMASALLLGGATQAGFAGDMILQIASIGLMSLALAQLRVEALPRRPLAIAIALLAIPLLQLVPLPPLVWKALPGREVLEQSFSAAELPLRWQPISLVPYATARSASALLPALAVFIAVLGFTAEARRMLSAVVLVIAGVGALFSLAQLAGGAEDGLYFYTITNLGRATGFFANSNHQALLLCASLPLVLLWTGDLSRPRKLAIPATITVLLTIGVAATSSRAGAVLWVLAGLGCLGLMVRRKGRIENSRVVQVVVASVLIAALIFFQFGFVGLAERIEGSELLSDLRWKIWALTLKATLANLPFGSGFGTFAPVYQAAEPREMLIPQYINRAHNDWLEVFLEGGLLTVAALGSFAVWYGGRIRRLWASAGSSRGQDATEAAWIGALMVALTALHSAFDYPLRTTAITVLFALACAFMVPASTDAAKRNKS